MTSAVFLGTAGLIALVRARDQYHLQAKKLLGEIMATGLSLITSEFVLLEASASLSRAPLRSEFLNFCRALDEEGLLEVVAASHELFEHAWQLYASRADKEWSIVDCSSFLVMQERTMTEAFTVDHHFEQAGFVVLLKRE